MMSPCMPIHRRDQHSTSLQASFCCSDSLAQVYPPDETLQENMLIANINPWLCPQQQSAAHAMEAPLADMLNSDMSGNQVQEKLQWSQAAMESATAHIHAWFIQLQVSGACSLEASLTTRDNLIASKHQTRTAAVQVWVQ